MSVYTVVRFDQIKRFLSRYELGELLDFHGIDEGIENTVYFVMTGAGDYVLTLFEEQKEEELRYHVGLMNHVAKAAVVPTPCLLSDRRGQLLSELCGKPATLVKRIPGATLSEVRVKHCRMIAQALAKLHYVTSGYRQRHKNSRGIDWMRNASDKLLPLLPGDEAALLSDEIAYQSAQDNTGLIQGTIHADLFRDNALFHHDRLSGVIDFYYACYDALIYDLAIVVNDWCAKENGSLDAARYKATVEAYCSVRSVSAEEERHWNRMLRLAALRFWLSRLEDHHTPRSRPRITVKDPALFRLILLEHRNHPVDLHAGHAG